MIHGGGRTDPCGPAGAEPAPRPGAADRDPFPRRAAVRPAGFIGLSGDPVLPGGGVRRGFPLVAAGKSVKVGSERLGQWWTGSSAP